MKVTGTPELLYSAPEARQQPALHAAAGQDSVMQQLPVQHTIDTPYMVGPVHCYSANLAGEPVLFDTGPPTATGKAYLRDNLDLKNLRHIFITHCHIDHYGLAHWLEEESEATIYMPFRDSLKLQHKDRRQQLMFSLLDDLGFNQRYLIEFKKVLGSRQIYPPLPKKYNIAEESVPDHLGISLLNCAGHSQSDLVYVGKDWAVTGDTLLRGIFQSPLLDIDLTTGSRFNNYHAYCKSIVRLASLSGRTILPGHKKSIAGVNDCLLFYISKMLMRVERLLPYTVEKNVAAMIAALFGEDSQDVFRIYLKTSEVLFMLDFLEQPEMLAQALKEIDLFTNIAEQYRLVTGGTASL